MNTFIGPQNSTQIYEMRLFTHYFLYMMITSAIRLLIFYTSQLTPSNILGM